MDNLPELVFTSALGVYLPVALGIASGFLLRRSDVTLDSGAFARVLVDIYIPIVIGLRVFIALNDLQDDSWRDGWKALAPIVLSAVLCLGWRRWRRLKTNRDIEGYAMGSTNSGFLGLPLLDLIFGKDPKSFVFYTVYQIGTVVYFLAFAPTLTSSKSDEGVKSSRRFYVKHFLLLAVALAVAGRLFGLPAGPLVRDCSDRLTVFFAHAGLLTLGLIIFQFLQSLRPPLDWH